MTNRRRRVDAAADAVSDGDGHALCLAGGVGEAVDNWIAGIGQDLSRALDSLVQRRRLSLDQRNRPLLDVMVEKPRFTEDAGVLGLGDLVVFDRQFHVIADAATEGARSVIDDLEFRHGDPLITSLDSCGLEPGLEPDRLQKIRLGCCSSPRARIGSR